MKKKDKKKLKALEKRVQDFKANRDKCLLRLDLIPSCVLIELSKVFARGAERYGEENWKKSRLFQDADPINHALKHILAYKDGIPDDEDPKNEDPQIHLRHALCNIVFELYYEQNPDIYPSRDTLRKEIQEKEKKNGRK